MNLMLPALGAVSRYLLRNIHFYHYRPSIERTTVFLYLFPTQTFSVREIVLPTLAHLFHVRILYKIRMKLPCSLERSTCCSDRFIITHKCKKRN
jgi:hypothetical protein